MQGYNSIRSTSSGLMLSKVEASKFKVFVVLLLSLFLIHYFIFAREALAHCPLCVGGAAIGLSVARFFGIDDAISGVWLAALLGAISFWTEGMILRKYKMPFLKPLLYILIFGLTIWSVYAFNDWSISKLKFFLINEHAGNIFGVDKLTFGIISGGVLFYLVDALDDWLIKRNGKVYFPYQRIVVSLGSMLLASLGLYVLINYFI